MFESRLNTTKTDFSKLTNNKPETRAEKRTDFLNIFIEEIIDSELSKDVQEIAIEEIKEQSKEGPVDIHIKRLQVKHELKSIHSEIKSTELPEFKDKADYIKSLIAKVDKAPYEEFVNYIKEARQYSLLAIQQKAIEKGNLEDLSSEDSSLNEILGLNIKKANSETKNAQNNNFLNGTTFGFMTNENKDKSKITNSVFSNNEHN